VEALLPEVIYLRNTSYNTRELDFVHFVSPMNVRTATS
jgi:hypothetical protein